MFIRWVPQTNEKVLRPALYNRRLDNYHIRKNGAVADVRARQGTWEAGHTSRFEDSLALTGQRKWEKVLEGEQGRHDPGSE